MKRKGFFLLALLCGLIAAGSMYVYLKNTDKNKLVAQKPLVVAKTDIAARSLIQASQLTTVEVPVQGYPQGGTQAVESVAGSVALVNLHPGDPVLKAMIERSAATTNGQTSGQTSNQSVSGGATALTVPEGKRAIAIPISLVSGVAYTVKPGDHVDVLATMDIKDGDSGSPKSNTDTGSSTAKTITSLVAQDVLVLNTGDSGPDKTKTEAKSYILAVSVPQAMAVTLASEKGGLLRLLLRNPADQTIRQDSPVSPNIFLDPKYFSIYK